MAADAALDVLATGNRLAHVALAERRRRAFASKWRLNRMIRRLVDSPTALSAATVSAAVVPAFVRTLISVAGDCGQT